MQTFLKNIVLCVLIAAYYFPSNALGVPKKRKYVSFAVVAASVVCFSIYSWMYIPLVDFTDYKAGAMIKSAGMPDEQGEDMYEAVFIYEKDGVEEVFDLEHLPDSTWNFVRTETTLKSEYADAIYLDLSFYDQSGSYMDHLATEGQVMVVSVYDVTKGKRFWESVAQFLGNAEASGFTPVLLVSSTYDQALDAFANLSPEVVEALKSHMYISDYKTIVAMNRSNGGVTYFCDGHLIRKWAKKSMPTLAELEEVSREYAAEIKINQGTKGQLAFQGFLLYVFAVMLLL